jgi:hypothetical protein
MTFLSVFLMLNHEIRQWQSILNCGCKRIQNCLEPVLGIRIRTKMSRMIPNIGWNRTLLGTTALKWTVLWFAYDMLPLEVGEESARQLTSRHRGPRSSEETAPAASIYLSIMLRTVLSINPIFVNLCRMNIGVYRKPNPKKKMVYGTLCRS